MRPLTAWRQDQGARRRYERGLYLWRYGYGDNTAVMTNILERLHQSGDVTQLIRIRRIIAR